MSSTNTEYEFTSSLKKDSNIYITKDRQYLYYNDLANGAYGPNTSEVKFELISLANTNQFVNWAESFVLIPLTLSAKATGGGLFEDCAENAFALSLKNGYQHIVDSLLITVNDNPINQPCQGANIPNTFRLYEMSEDDRKIIGDSMNFYMDTGDSIRLITPDASRYVTSSSTCAISALGVVTLATAVALPFVIIVGQSIVVLGVRYTITVVTNASTFTVSPVPAGGALAAGTDIDQWFTPSDLIKGKWNTGIGESNNIISKTNSIFNPIDGFLNSIVNEGRQKRIMGTSFDANQTQIATNFTSQSKVLESFRNSCITNTTTEITYNIFATIPMSVLHDFFDKLPIARGLSVRLNLYLNTGISINETIAGLQHVSIDSFTMPRQTCPFMISPLGADPVVGSGFRNYSAEKVTYSLTVGNTAQMNCRFYASLYTFNPQTESLYISSPERNILYNDVVQYLIPNVSANTTVNNLITSGISRLRGLLMIPILSSVSNICGGLDAKQSPFSSCPGTTFPYSKITNYQIQISGRPVYSVPISHNFLFYNTGVKPELSINGGSLRSLGMSSGCISKSDFENGYTYYYTDLTNIESEAEDNASKAVQVLFTNSGGTANLKIDFYIYLFFQKQIAINISNGAFIKLD